ncbi:3-hydroxyadipyl-CoA dehydrogenase [mine drainage metagenome]|uniref:3-hydroxyadipyl-CoA dehydrogenase n=1 Tax=mine drainage metagenome TaxID=410659 RepID=A0A1J5QV90_9ZZZZ
MVLLEGVAHRLPGDGQERVQHPRAPVRHGFEIGHVAEVQAAVHDAHCHGVGQIPLVVLENEGDLLDVQPVGIQVVVEVRQRVHVLLHLGFAGIRHEHHAVGAADIDLAMQLGTAYPRGPLAWGQSLGAQRVHALLRHLFEHYGDARYRIAPRLSEACWNGAALDA